MKKLTIIKIGGNVIDDEVKLSHFLQKFAQIEGNKILVHGGGKLATRMAEQMNVPQQMIVGRRVTNEETLKIITMVYAGYINKNIVAQLQGNGCNAYGVCGADGNLILAHKRPISSGNDFGFVGDIDSVNSEGINHLLQQDLSVVFSPITHDGNGQLLNTNADTIAQSLAISMSELYDVSLIYCFEKKGVLKDPKDDESFIPLITTDLFEDLKLKKIITDGMIPKVENALKASKSGVKNIIIGDAVELEKVLLHQSGTRINYE